MININVWADVFNNPVSPRDYNLYTLIKRYMPDVLTLEEVHPNWHKSKLQDVFKLGYKDADPNLDLNEINYTPLYYNSNAFEKIKSGFYKFSGPNDYNSKSITWALLRNKTTNEITGFIATHFYFEANKFGDDVRLNNAKETIELIKSIGDYPFFIGGDLNCNIESEAYKYLENNGYISSSQVAIEKENFICSYHEYPKYNKDTKEYTKASISHEENKYSIDHIIVPKNTKVIKYHLLTDDEALLATDHLPVLIDF